MNKKSPQGRENRGILLSLAENNDNRKEQGMDLTNRFVCQSQQSLREVQPIAAHAKPCSAALNTSQSNHHIQGSDT